jgi:hypothetical protein
MTNRCGAKTRTGGKCQKTAGWGTSHTGAGRCKLHGGSTTNGELHGNLELARRDAVVMGAPLPIDPHEAILQAIHIAAGEVQYCSDRIAELDSALVDVTTVKTRPLSHGKDGESESTTVEEITRSSEVRLHVWIDARSKAMDRMVAYSAAALKAGVEERQVRVAEKTGQLLASVIGGILEELGVSERPEAPAVVRRHLMLVSGSSS